jgi:hypothetical protein
MEEKTLAELGEQFKNLGIKSILVKLENSRWSVRAPVKLGEYKEWGKGVDLLDAFRDAHLNLQIYQEKNNG